MADEQLRYTFTVLGRYDARLRGNEPHVTVSVLAGRGDHAVYCGTLTMSEAEWESFAAALQRGLGEDLEIHDDRVNAAQ
jgi:hypothetical protein